MLGTRLQLLYESITRLMRRGARGRVQKLVGKTRPEDIAAVMRLLTENNRREVFDLLVDDEARAETLTELDPHILAEVVEGRDASHLAALVELMSADDQADVLAAMPEELREAVIRALEPDEAEVAEDLLEYDPETAGGIMSPEYFSLPEDTTAQEAITALQSAEDVEMAFYIYVVNEHGHLVGVVSLRALVTHPPRSPLSELMATDVISVQLETDQEEVARLAARYNLLAVPVVDEGNHLVGIVTIDDVIDVLREEATEDILKMAGADESAFEEQSVFKNFRSRAPWLFAAWAGGILASVFIGAFEAQLQAQVALAAFIPLVLGMGGNVGTQAATIMVRGLATGRVSGAAGWRYFFRESRIGLLLGALFGALLAGYAAFRYTDGGTGLAITVGISILATITNAASMGALIPLALERLSIDPAVATGPIVTTLVDVLGILVYFGVASVVLTNGAV